MYSEALQIMDRNMERYMIDELKEQISQKDFALNQRDAALHEKDVALSQKDAIIQRLLTKLAQLENTEDSK